MVTKQCRRAASTPPTPFGRFEVSSMRLVIALLCHDQRSLPGFVAQRQYRGIIEKSSNVGSRLPLPLPPPPHATLNAFSWGHIGSRLKRGEGEEGECGGSRRRGKGGLTHWGEARYARRRVARRAGLEVPLHPEEKYPAWSDFCSCSSRGSKSGMKKLVCFFCFSPYKVLFSIISYRTVNVFLFRIRVLCRHQQSWALSVICFKGRTLYFLKIHMCPALVEGTVAVSKLDTGN